MQNNIHKVKYKVHYYSFLNDRPREHIKLFDDYDTAKALFYKERNDFMYTTLYVNNSKDWSVLMRE